MVFIKKKLINLYKNKKKIYIYSKSRANTIHKDILGRVFFVYNGKKWIKKKIDNFYYINKSIGMLKNLDTKVVSIYKKNKKKLKQKKKRMNIQKK